MRVSFIGIKTVVLSLFCLIALTIQAQTIDQGRAALAEKDYGRAQEIFAKLIRSAPSNAQLGVLYGQVCIETGDYATAEKYLAPLAKRKVLNGCFYYARLCMHLYRFDVAITHYDLFLDKAKDEAMIAEAETAKAQAERAAALLRGTEDVQVIDSLVVDKSTFLQHYKLSDEAGFLYPFNQFFESPKGAESSVFETLRKDKIIYGLPVNERGYDLYTQVKLLDKYGDAKPLPEVINSEYNENYAYICSDGMTVYYASDNPEKSIGGYDILITRYSTSTDGYLAAENVGMPFNSMGNDYMMVLDDGYGVGWFASDRNQSPDKVCIYLFIPNPEKKVLEAEDPATRVAGAKLTSIKTTQKQSNYKAVLAAVFSTQPKETEIISDFLFPISNQIVYHFPTDFVSKQALSLFEQYRSASKKLNEQHAQLNELRIEFGKATQAKKKELNTKILAMENSVGELAKQIETLARECRNVEIKQIRK